MLVLKMEAGTLCTLIKFLVLKLTCEVIWRVAPVERKVLCVRPFVMQRQVGQSFSQRSEPGNKLVLLGVALMNSLALPKMSRGSEVRL